YRDMRLFGITKHIYGAAVVLMIIWILAVEVLVIGYAHDAGVARGYLKGAIPCDRDMINCFQNAAERIGVDTRRITLFQSYYVQSPMIVGLVKAKIIIPVGKYTDEELTIFFLHELTHYKHKDMYLKGLMSVVGILHFYNPVVCWLNSQLYDWCENMCDWEVYPVVGSKRYFEVIMSIVSTEQQRSKKTNFVAQLTSELCDVEERLTYMRKYDKVKKCPKIVAGMLAAMMVLLSSSAVSAATLGIQSIYSDVYDGTVEQTETGDINSDDVEYFITADEAQKIPMEWGHINVNARGLTTFSWPVRAGYMVQSQERFYVNAGSEIVVFVSMTPSDKYIDYGILKPDYSLVYVHAKDNSSHAFSADQSGYYRIFVRNDNDVTIQVDGSYMVR
ncbi:MAG: M56 family metallopeptidase, partial [Lachnospiraceae bacterium]